MRILAIDPGREKCGLVFAADRVIVDRAVVPTADLASTLREWSRRHRITQVILGDRTGHDDVRKQVDAELPDIPVVEVRETDTTLMARRRYFADHPPRGWRRLLPLSMQVPPEPYDDYAAAVILERFIEAR